MIVIKSFFNKLFKKNSDTQDGFMLVELLVATALLAIFGLGITRSTIMSLQMRKKSMIFQQANQLALNKLEEYSRVGADDLEGGTSTYETQTVSSLDYDINCYINAENDGSKTVFVDVTSSSKLYPVTVSLSNTYR